MPPDPMAAGAAWAAQQQSKAGPGGVRASWRGALQTSLLEAATQLPTPPASPVRSSMRNPGGGGGGGGGAGWAGATGDF